MKRKAFYNALRPTLGAFSRANVAGFELVLDEARRRGADLHDLAYILATAWWETAKTMQPVREAFWLSEDWRKRNLRYYPFYGRGLVQLTWEANYRKASELYGVDFVKKPDLVMQPEHAVRILFDGMIDGWFTGKDIDDYIDPVDEADDEDLREFSNARRVVNGTDKQVEIGKLALSFESALKAADYGEPPIPTPKPEDAPMPEMPKKELTPPEQMNKPIAGIKGGALAASIGGAVLVLLNGSGWLPDGWQSAEAQGALTVLFTTLPALIVGFWRGYQAPDLRYTQD